VINISKKPDKYGRYKVNIRKREKLERSLIFFEGRTIKWYRLLAHLDGLKSESLGMLNEKPSIDKVIKVLNKLFPRKRKNTLTFTDIVKVVKNKEKVSIVELMEHFEKKNSVIYAYVGKLVEWKVLLREKIDGKCMIRLNEGALMN
tara:strand:+ start:28538 stop:28975 length:438 start_codon:yes stop_codon:yes gene_type:complete